LKTIAALSINFSRRGVFIFMYFGLDKKVVIVIICIPLVGVEQNSFHAILQANQPGSRGRTSYNSRAGLQVSGAAVLFFLCTNQLCADQLMNERCTFPGCEKVELIIHI
jgi:hypothetical protein